MSKSPGHHKWPEHGVREVHLGQRMQVRVGDVVLADSNDVIKVEEDGSPARYYFPRGDVRMDALEPSETMTKCPFKGTAHYYRLVVADKKLDDAVWSYEEPYDEHLELRERLSFYADRIPEIDISPRP